MDDRMVADAFEQLVVRLDDGRAPGLDELRGRALRRRHRRARRTLLAAAGVLVVLGVGVAVRAGSDGDSQRVEMRPDPTTTAATTTAPAAARPHPLTVGAIPDGLAFAGCGSMPQDVPIVYCRYDEPTSLASVDGLTIGVSEGAVDDAARAAWDRGDAGGVWAAITDSPDPGAADPRFVRLGGIDVVALGVTDVVPGASLGLPDRVSRGFVFIEGDDVFQIGAEQATDEQVGEVLAGLGPSPAYPGLAIDPAVLPEGARLVVQGERPRWSQPDPFDPSASSPAAGRRYGGLYFVPTSRSPIDIEVAADVDAVALLKGFTARNVATGEAVTVAGRGALRLGRGIVPERGQPFGSSTPSVIVAVDDRTVVQVSVDRLQEGDLDAIVAAVIDDLG